MEALLHRTNLYEHRKKALSGFSGGMRQRFGIAQALLGNPRLLIVDEPTAGLDPGERNRFYSLLSEIGEDVIVILSTHIVEDVMELCTNMAIIHQGKVLFAGAPSEAVKSLEGVEEAVDLFGRDHRPGVRDGDDGFVAVDPGGDLHPGSRARCGARRPISRPDQDRHRRPTPKCRSMAGNFREHGCPRQSHTICWPSSI